ncbi:hypothetical protein C7A10_26770 [Pseudomonas fluorescens]|uniref:Uncharacterized protein n=1 Tax=Pseudomonas fluorescens TaxID=294 RepID=A0A2T0HRH1_PSEFL|nr:hypothetical protein C7A10_26770 [Pseudomonas fluorescens]
MPAQTKVSKTLLPHHVTHEFKPAFGQRGLTGRLRSRSKADQDQERLARFASWLPVGGTFDISVH